MTGHGFDLEDRLREREERDLRRHLRPAESVAARTRFAPDPKGDQPAFDDETVVFAANDYLGLATDDRLQRAAEVGARTVGTGAGASRLVTGDTALHRALERDLAAYKGTERSLVFSSGYAANVGTIEALDPDVIFSDALNHASVVDGCRLADAETVVYDHCDPDALARAMADRDRAGDADGDDPPDDSGPVDDGASWLVVTDGVFSMDGDVAPLGAICDVAEAHGAWVMVDDAHGTGVLGEEGAGVVRRRGLSDRVDVQVGTLSKALGSQGGFVAGEAALVEYLSNAARSFVFSTGLAPPAVASAREGLRIARESNRRHDLLRIAERLRRELTAMGYDVLGDTHVLPVLVGDREDALALERALRERGIVAPAIRPPTVPDGRSRVRLSPRATHADGDVDACLRAFRTAGEEVGLL